jgi:hypothetical protein
VYVYPAVVTRAYTRTVQFTGIGDGYVGIRGKTRLYYPDRGFNTLLLPGSRLRTFVLLGDKQHLPKYIRIGSKRFGILRAKYTSLTYETVESAEITHPANAYDSEIENEGLLFLKHKGGNIVTMAHVPIAIEAKVQRNKGVERVVLVPPLRLLGREQWIR